jgi:hypothetical protein
MVASLKTRCYKGAYCEDKHIMSREGAVTADQEKVIIGTEDLLGEGGVYTVLGTQASEGDNAHTQ